MNKLEKLGKGLARDEADACGKDAVAKMKDLISKGISPVRGSGIATKFAKYLKPKRYPGNKKPHSPVNLRLSGDMLNDLDYEVEASKNGYVAIIGYRSPKQIVKEQGHREMKNGQPSRPTIPAQSKGESFARTIEDAYLKIIVGAFKRRT